MRPTKRTNERSLHRDTLVLILYLPLLFVSAAVVHAQGTAAHDSQVASQQTQTVVPQPSPVDALRNDLTGLTTSVAEVRRDQLNYQIERDLLKETYGSNLQTINIVIAFVFGAVTVIVSLLGYFGLKNVREVREDFQRELSEFRASRSEVEERLGDLMRRATDASERLNALSRENTKHDERLKYLELIERIGALYGQRRFADAIRYLDVAIEIQPKDELTRLMKAACHLNLMQFDEAEAAFRAVVALDPPAKAGSVQSCVENLAELYAFRKSPSESAAFEREHSAHLLAARPLLADYFTAIRCAREDDAPGVLNVIRKTLQAISPGTKPLGDWGLNEARFFVARMGEGEAVKLLVKLMDLLEVKIAPDALRAELKL
ncbi:MAG: tetratricopeptide repeat protein [Candidatus Acidoferrum typicum]|nr:tetratricopeptide repeat protein [Candidatus Acidoferrum typicum]